MEEVTLVLPEGLVRCERCGEARGRFVAPEPQDPTVSSDVRVSCLCEGLPCPHCGVGRIHRPISDYYDAVTGRPVHVPYFGHVLPCRECRARGVMPRAVRGA